MPRYSLKNLLLEIDTIVATPDAGDRYVYRRKDDGWYTRNSDWPASRGWAFLDPKKPNFAKAIERLNKAYPKFAFDISKITPKSQETQKSMTAAPKAAPSGDAIPSLRVSGDSLRKRQALGLEDIATGKLSPVTPDNYASSGRMLPLYATQFILGVKQGDFNAETQAALEKFQKDNNVFPRKESGLFDMFQSDDPRLGTIDKLTARALLKTSKEAATLGVTTYYDLGDYPVEESEASSGSFRILKGIETRGVKVNLRKGDFRSRLSAGETVQIALCAVDQCATYVGLVFTQGSFRNDGGDAWTQHKLSQVKSGVIKYTPFKDLTDEQIASITSAFRLSCRYGIASAQHPKLSAIVGSFVPDQASIASNIELGDVVGLYNRGSDSFAKAIFQAGKNYFLRPGITKDTPTNQRTAKDTDLGKDIKWVPGNTLTKERIGFGMNTHLGVIGAIIDGIPIAFHNVHGTIKATPVIPGTDYPVMWFKTPQTAIIPTPVS